MNGDYEVWHAVHDNCGPDGCGGCVVVDDVEISDEIILAAKILGESLDVFIHKAVRAGMEYELGKRS